MIAQFTGEKITSASADAFSLNEKSQFGEKKKGKIEYSLVEALYLMDEKNLEIYSGSKKLSLQDLLKKVKKLDKRVETKLTVFSDLRKKGHIVKTALKYGADFRVYEKGTKPGQEHAKWVLYTVKEHESFNWQEFAAKNRVAHSTKKKLLIAIVDEESDVTYYEVSWTKP